MLTLRNMPYRLHRVQFLDSRLTILAALPRTMDRSNAKLGDGAKTSVLRLASCVSCRKA